MSKKPYFCLFFVMVLLVLLSPRSKPARAEESHLIVSIIDAEYPPKTYSAQEKPDYTLFEFVLQIQIENPTQSTVEGSFWCSPLPYPQLNTTLRNKSLTVNPDAILEWAVGDFSIYPGKTNRSASLSFWVNPYQNKSLPLGVYEFWFDYVFCSSVPVPVITEKMYIDVSETSVTYYFDYNNESRVVSSIQQTNFTEYLFGFTSIIMVAVFRIRNHKKKRL